MWKVDPHDFHPAQIALAQGVHVDTPVRFFVELVVAKTSPRKSCHRRVRRIPGIGHQHFIAFVEERHGDVHDAFLGSDEWKYHGFRVKRDLVDFLIKCGNSLPERWDPLVALVPVVCGITSGGNQCFDRVG